MSAQAIPRKGLVEIVDGALVITLPLEKKPRPSASGNTLLVASTGGFTRTDVEVDGRPVSVSVNATIKTK